MRSPRNLDVITKGKDGTLYGYDREGRRQKITFDTRSIYALKNGKPVFEVSGGDFSKLVYDRKSKAFTSMDPETTLFHLFLSLSHQDSRDRRAGPGYPVSSRS